MSEDGDRRAGHGEHDSMALGRYRLDEQVGAGGMGVLWRATDTLLDGVVALKRVPLARLGSGSIANTRERTLREARMAAKLRGHPHVVSIFDAQVADDDVWLVLEYLPSRSLAQVLAAQGSLEPGEVARIGAAVADALDAAHRLGIQHRDVTPANVLIGTDGTVKLTDFGLAQSIGDARLTQTGAVAGTVAYLAPEIAREGEPEMASDVFSLGATLYAALEGLPPFGRNTNAFKLLQIVSTGIIRPPQRAGPLEPLLVRMLTPTPAARPGAATVRDWLAHVATRYPDPPPALPDDNAKAMGASNAASGDPTDVTPANSDGTAVRRRRRRAIWLGAAGVVLVVASLVATALLGGNGAEPGQADAQASTKDYSGNPAWPELTGLPRTVGQVGMGDEVESIDPCELLPAEALRRFGNVAEQRGTSLYGCQVRVTNGSGDQASVGFELGEPRPDAIDLGGPGVREYDLGGVQVYQSKMKSKDDPAAGTCEGQIAFTDNSVLYMTAIPMTSAKFTPNPCELVATLNTAIVRQVAGSGSLPHTGWGNDFPLTMRDACSLVGERTLAKVPGLRYKNLLPGFADSNCKWGENPDDPELPAVFVEFFLQEKDEFSARNANRAITIGGKRAYQTVVDSEVTENNCTISLPQQSKPSDEQRYAVVRVRAQVPAERPQQCASAELVATAVQRSLQSKPSG